MKRWRVSYHCRKNGAIGITSVVTREVEAEDMPQAFEAFREWARTQDLDTVHPNACIEVKPPMVIL